MVNSITNSLIIVSLLVTSGFAFAQDTDLSKQDRQELVDQAKDLKDQPSTSAQSTPAPTSKSNVRVYRKKKPVQEPETELTSKIGFSTGVTAWGEQIELLTGDGRQENILVQYTGFAFGLDYTLKGDSVGWNTAVKAMILAGDAQAEGQSITYQNKVDNVTPLFASTGLRFYPHDKVNITLNVGATYYKLKLEAPTSVVTSYDFKYADSIQPIAQLQLGWMVSDSLLFQQEIFAAQKNNASVGWIVSIGYVF